MLLIVGAIVFVAMIAILKCDASHAVITLLLVQVHGRQQALYRVLSLLPAGGCSSSVVGPAVDAARRFQSTAGAQPLSPLALLSPNQS